MNSRAPFKPDAFYHLYNHAVGNENLFRSPDNYRFFLQRYAHYTTPIIRTYAYCLMPNHFHFLIQVRPEDEISIFFERKQKALKRKLKNKQSLSNQIGQVLGNWLSSYAKSFNKRYKRRGRLFIEQIRRIQVSDQDYLTNLVQYIHWNPVHHGFTSAPEDWSFSSYKIFTMNQESILEQDAVFDWFGGEEEFIFDHFTSSQTELIDELEFFE